MASRKSSWLHEMLYVWRQYLAVVIAAIPAGLIYFALTRAGTNETAALYLSAVLALGFGYLIWKVLFEKSSPAAVASKDLRADNVIYPNTQVEMFDFNRNAAAWSGAVIAVSVAVSCPPTIRYQPLGQNVTTSSNSINRNNPV